MVDLFYRFGSNARHAVREWRQLYGLGKVPTEGAIRVSHFLNILELTLDYCETFVPVQCEKEARKRFYGEPKSFPTSNQNC